MAVTLAHQTTPGCYYRRTTFSQPGVYYTRPKTTKKTNPGAWVARLVTKRDPLGSYWSLRLKAVPDSVLLCLYHRGTSTFTGERWEVKRYVLVPPDFRLRQVKTRPGYT
jgi:hypothetical protein